MRAILLAFLGLLLNPLPGLASAPPIVKSEMEIERLHSLFDHYFKKTIQDYPETATVLGIAGYDHLWSDLSHATYEKQIRFNKEMLKRLEKINLTRVSEEDRLNASILEWQLKNQLAWSDFKNELMPVTQQRGPHLDTSLILQIMPTESLEQYENILSRLRGLPKLLNQTMALLEEGKKEKITPPKITLEGVPDSILKQLPENPEESLYFKPFLNIPEAISEADRSRLKQQARTVIISEVYPAMRALHDYFVKSYLPKCRETTAMRDLPHGRSWYRQAVKSYTTSLFTPEEIHRIGLNEVKRIQKEMKQIIPETGFTGDLAQFFAFMRSDPQFVFASREELLEEYRRLLTIIESQLPNLFGRLPKTPYIVQAVPEHSEKTAPGAYYLMGSPKAGRPGMFFVNTYDLKTRLNWETEPLALHEALPGHHMQLSIAMENENIPAFRALTDSTAYIEGWGLYSEGLGNELGLYTTPYSRFGGLHHELFRAIRLVVDTGLHSKGWSREKAIDYFMKNSCMPEHEVVSEINRYIVNPGQALAYKIGQMHILKMRRHAKMFLGNKFDIRTFHDALLEQGDMPLNILEIYMNTWIVSQR